MLVSYSKCLHYSHNISYFIICQLRMKTPQQPSICYCVGSFKCTRNTMWKPCHCWMPSDIPAHNGTCFNSSGNIRRHPAMAWLPHSVSGTLEGADAVTDRGLLWGLHPKLTDDEVGYVMGVVEAFRV